MGYLSPQSLPCRSPQLAVTAPLRTDLFRSPFFQVLGAAPSPGPMGPGDAVMSPRVQDTALGPVISPHGAQTFANSSSAALAGVSPQNQEHPAALHSPTALEVGLQSQCLQGHSPSGGSGKNPFLASPSFWLRPAFLGSGLCTSALCLKDGIAFSHLHLVSLHLSLTRTLVTALRTHQDHLGESPHFKSLIHLCEVFAIEGNICKFQGLGPNLFGAIIQTATLLHLPQTIALRACCLRLLGPDPYNRAL